LDAEEKNGLWGGGWGTGNRGRTWPALQMAGLQGRTFCWAQPYLRRQRVYIPADIRARACLAVVLGARERKGEARSGTLFLLQRLFGAG